MALKVAWIGEDLVAILTAEFFEWVVSDLQVFKTEKLGHHKNFNILFIFIYYYILVIETVTLICIGAYLMTN